METDDLINYINGKNNQENSKGKGTSKKQKNKKKKNKAVGE
jgi:hypothetical protein